MATSSVTRREVSVEEAQRFLEVAESSHYGPIYAFILATGMRRGEVLGLCWKDVSFERGTATVRQTLGTVHGHRFMNERPKTSSSRRTIPVDPYVMDLLRTHKAQQNERRLAMGPAWEDHDLVFCNKFGRPIMPRHLQREYAPLVEMAGVPYIRIHDSRHTHATIAIQEGASIKAVSERLGHAKTSTTLNVYIHATSAQRQEVSDKVCAALFGTLTG